jgi:hypothetical protein
MGNIAASIVWRQILERAKGFEPSTPTLARLYSTPELHPHPRRVRRQPGQRSRAIRRKPQVRFPRQRGANSIPSMFLGRRQAHDERERLADRSGLVPATARDIKRRARVQMDDRT